jgi:hypothetical protein
MIGLVLAAVGIFLTGCVVGGIIEHHKSQWEIGVLTKVIEGCCKEDITHGSQTNRSE